MFATIKVNRHDIKLNGQIVESVISKCGRHASCFDGNSLIYLSDENFEIQTEHSFEKLEHELAERKAVISHNEKEIEALKNALQQKKVQPLSMAEMFGQKVKTIEFA